MAFYASVKRDSGQDYDGEELGLSGAGWTNKKWGIVLSSTAKNNY
jgi:hypothetical protein